LNGQKKQEFLNNKGGRQMVAPEQTVAAVEYYDGQTYIRIFDSFCKEKTPQNVEEILRRIADRAIKRLVRTATNETL
jgi:hypothetical protein